LSEIPALGGRGRATWRVQGHPEIHSETLSQKKMGWGGVAQESGNESRDLPSQVSGLSGKGILSQENPGSASKNFKNVSQALMSHTCNPSYSGGRDQKAHGSKPAQANSLRDLSQEKKKKVKLESLLR
jgi:hypothetical protein